MRIIAATNKNLQDLVNNGSFREDLFYRINVVCLSLPPLRERKEDIPLLIEHFIRKNNLLREKKINGFSQEALAILMSYDFRAIFVNWRILSNTLLFYAVKVKLLPIACRRR